MGQPKLSNQSTQPLLTIGPFDGLDATSDPLAISGTYARDVLNFVPNHTYKALTPIRGRIPGQFPLPNPPTSLAIFYPYNVAPDLMACTEAGAFYHQKQAGPIISQQPWKGPIPLPNAPGGQLPTGAAGSFASYKSWLFFSNGNPNSNCYKFDRSLNATFWGITAPPKAPQEQTTSPANGMIYGNAIYYRYTYAANNSTDPGLSQESSPSPPAGPFNIGTTLGPPTSNGATIAQTPAPTLAAVLSGGSIPDGTYTVGITWVAPGGEGGISVTSQVTISGGGGAASISITPNGPPVGATGWNVYTGTIASLLTQQNGTRAGTGAGTELSYTTTGGPPPAYTGFLNPPTQPVVHTSTSGNLPARTEYYQLTYVNGNGETTASPETAINLAAGQVAVVVSPGAQGNATGYNVYGSLTSSQEVLQTASPISIGTNWTEPNAGLILGQSAFLTLQASPDPQVTTINIYRIGGQSLDNWYYVGSVPNIGFDGQITFTDNTPDNQVTGQAMVLHRDPPAPFNAVFMHLDRLMGFGYPLYTDFNGNKNGARPSDLWYSNYAEPWGFDNTNQVLPVGAQDSGDVGIAGGSLSGLAILWKAKTTWALYGSSPSDFFVSKLFDIGAVSFNGCFIAMGVAFWLSRQGMYMWDQATLTYISKPIKKILDAMSDEDFEAACGTFDDRIAWWSFPTQGISLGYDTVSQNWFKASLTSTLFAFDTEAQSRPVAADWVFGVEPGYGAVLVDQWFAATTDYGLPIVSTMLTRLATSGPQIGTMRSRYLELITSTPFASSDSVLLTVTADPATVARSFSKTFLSPTLNLRQRAGVPPGIQGDEFQLQITANSTDALVVDAAATHGWVRRLYNMIA